MKQLIKLILKYNENKEETINKILNNKNLILKIRNKILRFGWRRLLTPIKWQILNLTCLIIKDKIRSPLLKQKIREILEEILPNILNRKEQRIIFHILNLKNTYIELISKLEGAMKNIYIKIINNFEYLYHKALNLIAGEIAGIYINYT